MREQIEERFFSFRDIFAALFFFVFGLSIDVGAIADVGVLVGIAVLVTIVGKIGAGMVAGRVGGFTRRQSFNAGVALDRARRVHDHPRPARDREPGGRRRPADRTSSPSPGSTSSSPRRSESCS